MLGVWFQVFLHTWTVNWKFLPEAWFVSRRLALLLLAAHLRLLWSYAQHRWCVCLGAGFGSICPA